jgi:hypothetical protein
MNPTAYCDRVDMLKVRRTKSASFRSIFSYYRKHYEALEASGSMPYRSTSLGAWATSRAVHVFYFFRNIGLSRYRLFIDLGSGDGIVTCIAGCFTHAVGIEVDRGLCSVAQIATRELNLDQRVSFICGDYLKQRIWQADCLYVYPDKPIHAVEELLPGWMGILLIYGPHFPPRHLVPVCDLRCGGDRLVGYQNPSDSNPAILP